MKADKCSSSGTLKYKVAVGAALGKVASARRATTGGNLPVQSLTYLNLNFEIASVGSFRPKITHGMLRMILLELMILGPNRIGSPRLHYAAVRYQYPP